MTWPSFYAARSVNVSLAADDMIGNLLVGIVAAAMICTLPLTYYAVRVMRTSASAWQKSVVIAGLLAGLSAYALPFVAYFAGLGAAIGARH
jgi:uncharacterized membrane protein YccF (DUF307 family)